MDLLSMFSPKRVTLRVTSERDPATFDALVVFDGRHGFATQRFSEQRTPFEAQLSDGDVTIVVRPRDVEHPVVAEYEVAVSGKRRLWVRSWAEIPVMRRRKGGVIGAGLPAPSAGSDEPPVGAPVI